MLHLAVDADECTLAVRDRRPIEQLDELRHQPFAEHRSCFEQQLKLIHEPAGEGVADHGHTHRTHNGSRCGGAEFRENYLAHLDNLADLDHLVLLRISATAPPYRILSPTEQVDLVDVVDVFLINA